jgi:hypothetical protein
LLLLAQEKGPAPLLAFGGVKRRPGAVQPLSDIDVAEGSAFERPRRRSRRGRGAPEQGQGVLEQSHEFGRREICLGRADHEIEKGAWHRERDRHARRVVDRKLSA